MPLTPPSAFESNRAPCEMCGGHHGDPWETDPAKTRVLAIRHRIDEPGTLWTICDECHTGLIGALENFTDFLREQRSPGS